MNADEMTIEQHLTVLYLLDIAMGENISAVEVNGFSDLPEGAVLLRSTQTLRSGPRANLAYEIARDGSHRRHSPQETSTTATTSEKVWRGQDTESFPGVWYPFRTPTDQEWLELRQQLGRDPLDPLLALEPVLDAVAPSHELETESGEPPLDAEHPAPESSSEEQPPSPEQPSDDGARPLSRLGADTRIRRLRHL
jgi:hypothetical protein